MKNYMRLVLWMVIAIQSTFNLQAQEVLYDFPLTNFEYNGTDIKDSFFDDWVVNNYCYAVEEKDNAYLQIGDRKNFGSITTPALTKLTADEVEISFEAETSYSTNDSKPTYDPTYLNISVEGQGKLNTTKIYLYSHRTFTLFNTIKPKGANAETRLKFSGSSSNGNPPGRFLIRNIKIVRPKQRTVLFNETFDKMTGTGGNDGDASSSKETVTTSDFDNKGISISYSPYACNGCISLDSDANTSFTINSAPLHNGSAWMTFRIMGTVDNAEMKISTPTGIILTQSTFPATKGIWKEYSVALYGKNASSTSIKFTNNSTTKKESNKGVFVDDVRIYQCEAVSMDEAADNSQMLLNNAGEGVDITLARTLKRGIWNTLCLPFSVSRQHFANLTTSSLPTIEMRQLSSAANNKINFANTVYSTIPAGEPFLLQISEDLVNPTFKGVLIETTEPQEKSYGNYSFAGIFSPKALKTDGTEMFLGTDNVLYVPAATTNTINGLRGYFKTNAPGAVRPAITIDDDPAGISLYYADREDGCIYNLSGQRIGNGVQMLRKGLYISNGRKFVVR